MSFSKFTNLSTEDYQKRGGRYPKSNIPDSINVYDDYIIMSFKNTTERSGARFAERFSRQHGIEYKNIDTCQDGDYVDDWISVCLYPVSSK